MTGLVAPTSLARELGRSLAACVGREGRELCLRTVLAPVLVRVCPAPALLREEGFRVRVEAVVLVRSPELGVPSLAEEDWVGAVAEAGSRTGLVGDLVRALGAWAFVGDVFEVSWDGVEPRVVRDEVFAAGFREARLGLWARLDRSLATSRAESGLVVVLEDDIVPGEAEVEAGLLEALLLAVLMFDGRFVTVFAPGLSGEALDPVFVVELTAGSLFAT